MWKEKRQHCKIRVGKRKDSFGWRIPASAIRTVRWVRCSSTLLSCRRHRIIRNESEHFFPQLHGLTKETNCKATKAEKGRKSLKCTFRIIIRAWDLPPSSMDEGMAQNWCFSPPPSFLSLRLSFFLFLEVPKFLLEHEEKDICFLPLGPRIRSRSLFPLICIARA